MNSNYKLDFKKIKGGKVRLVPTQFMKLKWTNKYSGEQGYVKSIKPSRGYFESTSDENEARNFRSANEAQKAIDQLIAMGEAENNSFETVE